jgi:hypothetical protein
LKWVNGKREKERKFVGLGKSEVYISPMYHNSLSFNRQASLALWKRKFYEVENFRVPRDSVKGKLHSIIIRTFDTFNISWFNLLLLLLLLLL